jgi:TonB family protein
VSGFESLLLSYLLNSFWQIPLLVAAAFVAARILRPAGPSAEHRVWVAALLLESLLPALSIIPLERLHIEWPWSSYSAPFSEAHVSVQVGAGAGLGVLRLPSPILTALAIAFVVLTVYFTARFAWQCMRLSALAKQTEPLHLTGEAAVSWARWSNRFGIGPITLASSREIFAPVTIGVARKRVLLPVGIVTGLAHSDLDTAIAHEFAHIRRNDFLKNLIYELLSLPVSYHPGRWLIRQQVMETREMVCDQMAAEVSGNHEFAQSLLRLAALLLQGRSIKVPQAIGVFDANTLERRLMKLTENKKQIGRLRRRVSIGATLALGVVTAASALALRIGVDPGAVLDSHVSQKFGPQVVPADKMADHLLNKVPPKYPPEAKKARIQGKVVLDAVIAKTGLVENLKVVSGPTELQASALDAVRQWTYRPVLLNGAPVEVKTTVTVIYSLKK